MRRSSVARRKRPVTGDSGKHEGSPNAGGSRGGTIESKENGHADPTAHDGKPHDQHSPSLRGKSLRGKSRPKSPMSESGSTFSNDRKPSGPEEAWHDWERDEMEDLLGEVRGHLGKSILPSSCDFARWKSVAGRTWMESWARV